MKTIYLPLIYLLIITPGTISGQEITNTNFPLQLSFVYPIGTHGVRSATQTFDFSLNILTGRTGNIYGFETGGLINLNTGNVSGAQVGGIGNITDGNLNGIQIAGLFNMADSVDGVQIGGVLCKSSVSNGLQISGITSITYSAKANISGIANINRDSLNGLQIAGIINTTRYLHGLQIGLINIADTVDNGVSIGLVSLVRKNMYREWSVTVADYMNAGVSYKLGVKDLYTIYSTGVALFKDDLWVFGLGLGHLQKLNQRISIQPEIICYTYFPVGFGRDIRDTYIGHFKFGILRNINDHIAISFAPSLYLSLKSDRGKYDEFGYDVSPVKPFFDVHQAGTNSLVGFGCGFSIGLHILQ